MEKIGDKLKKLRKLKRLTQDEVAHKVGLNRSTLSNYEINRRTPHLNELERFAEFYGVSIEYFSVSAKDEAFDLLTRAKDVFKSENVLLAEKEELYYELSKLYMSLKQEEEQKNENN